MIDKDDGSSICRVFRNNARSCQVMQMESVASASMLLLLLLSQLIAVSATTDLSGGTVPHLRRAVEIAESALWVPTESEYNGKCFAKSELKFCQDNADYRTTKGLPCSFHAELISALEGENCFHEWLGDTWFSKTYDQEQIFDLSELSLHLEDVQPKEIFFETIFFFALTCHFKSFLVRSV